MTRRCSHCSNNGHNARTCHSRGVSSGGGGGGGGGGGRLRLFGMQVTSAPVAATKKSTSMSCIVSSHEGGSGGSTAAAGAGGGARGGGDGTQGYVSNDAMHASCSTNGRGERKKGLSSFLAITACHHTVDLWWPAPLTSSDGMNGTPVLWYLSTLQQEVVYYISI